MEHRPSAARPAQFSDLDGCIINAIVRCLDPASRAAFAATSLAHLSAVLEATPGRWSSAGRYGEAVAQRLHAHGCQAAGSRVGWAVSGNWRMYCRAGADPADERSIVRVVATKVLRLKNKTPDEALKCRMDPPPITAGMEALELLDIRGTDSAVLEGEDWIPRPARATLRTLWASDCSIRRVPPGLTSLEKVLIGNVRGALDDGWLPESSRATVRELIVAGVCVIPPGMSALQSLTIADPPHAAWLPTSSAASLTKLRLLDAGVSRLPEGLVALQDLHLIGCDALDVDFLPASSGRNLKILYVASVLRNFTVPAHLERLESLSIQILTFGDNWLPTDVGKSLKSFSVLGGGLRSVPPGLEQLEKLALIVMDEFRSHDNFEQLQPFVVRLDGDWLPPSSRRRIKKLDLSGTNVERIPAGCEALEELVVARCDALDLSTEQAVAASSDEQEQQGTPEPWIDACSAANVRRLDASLSTISRVPATFTALTHLNVSGCKDLSVDWLPADCRGTIRELLCARSSLGSDLREILDEHLLPEDSSGLSEIPSGLTALQTLDVQGCELLNDDFIDGSSSQALRKLNIGGTPVTHVRGMPCLEDLDVRGCKHLAEDFVDAVSGRNVAKLDARNSSLKRVPAHMTRLRHLRVEGCKELAEDWLEGLPDGADVLVQGDDGEQRVVVAEGKVARMHVDP